MPDIVYLEKLGDAMAPVGLREDPSLFILIHHPQDY